MSEEKQTLLDKLSKVFDPETAVNFVSPKTFETRKHLTIEDLKNGNNNDFFMSMFLKFI